MRILILIAVLLGLSRPAAARVRVVATVPALAAIASAVGGQEATITSLSLATQDPHFVDARPNLALELSRADLLVVVGLDLEMGWLPNLQTGSRNPKIQVGAPGYVDCSGFISVLEAATGPVSRAQGDIHPGGNPHYFYDPRAATPIALGLAQRMAAADPAQAATYVANARAFVARLEAAQPGWEARAASLRNLPVITYHRSLIYLQDWLGFAAVAQIEPRPGIPPTPAHVAGVLQIARSRQVTLILQERYYPATAAEQIARLANARVVVLPSGPDLAAGEDYLAFVDGLIAALTGGA